MSSEEHALTPDDQIIGDDTTQTVDTSAKADGASESESDDQTKAVQPPEAVHVKANLDHPEEAELAHTPMYYRVIMFIVFFGYVIAVMGGVGLVSTGNVTQAQQSMTIPRDHFPLHGAIELALLCFVTVVMELVLLRRKKEDGKRVGEKFTNFSRGIGFSILAVPIIWFVLWLSSLRAPGSVHSNSVVWFDSMNSHPFLRILLLIMPLIFAVWFGERAVTARKNVVATIIIGAIMVILFILWDGAANQ